MAHSRVSRFPGLADAPEQLFISAVNERTYRRYVQFCENAGVRPAQYDQWRQLTDDSYKLAGVTRK